MKARRQAKAGAMTIEAEQSEFFGDCSALDGNLFRRLRGAG